MGAPVLAADASKIDVDAGMSTAMSMSKSKIEGGLYFWFFGYISGALDSSDLI